MSTMKMMALVITMKMMAMTLRWRCLCTTMAGSLASYQVSLTGHCWRFLEDAGDDDDFDSDDDGDDDCDDSDNSSKISLPAPS